MHNLTVDSQKVDFAALGPSCIIEERQSYYKTCAELLGKIKSALQSNLAQDHDLYVMSNATHALTTALYGLHQDGFQTAIRNDNYEPYIGILNGDNSTYYDEITLIPHVNPITGVHNSVLDMNPEKVILDATQSFGTICHHHDILKSYIFFTSLHKHIDIQPGIGILAISKRKQFRRLRELATINENSSKNVIELEAIHNTINSYGDRLYNISQIRIDKHLRSVISESSIKIDENSPEYGSFICLQNVPSDWISPPMPKSVSLKYFKKLKMLRISTHVRGRIDDDPVDQSHAVINFLNELVAQNAITNI